MLLVQDEAAGSRVSASPAQPVLDHPFRLESANVAGTSFLRPNMSPIAINRSSRQKPDFPWDWVRRRCVGRC